MDPGGSLISGERAQRAASPRLFQNKLLDRLSRVHHLVPVLFYLPLVAGLLAFGLRRTTAAQVLMGFIGGYVLWTLIEYMGHRFLFHYRPKSAAGKRLQYLIHDVHHEYPEDPLRLVMPPLMSVPIMLIAAAVLRGACGPDLFPAALAGFVAGYLAYDMLHFHIHNRRPKSSPGRFLRSRHMYHHYRDNTCCFGVSAPWWDGVFGTQGTLQRPSQKPASAS